MSFYRNSLRADFNATRRDESAPRTLTVTRAAYRRLVALANAQNAQRRLDEPKVWATVQTWDRYGEPLPRPWRTDLKVVGSSDWQ